MQAADWGAGKEGVNPPRLLAKYLDCLYFRTLPKAGGLDDQPAGLLDRMSYLHQVAEAVRAYEKDGKAPGEQAAWCKKHPQWWKLIKEIRELRKQWPTARSS